MNVSFIKKRWLLSCLFAFACSACNPYSTASDNTQQLQLAEWKAARQKHSLECIDSARLILKDGDIITRTGNDFTSQGLRQLCQLDATYSHCGIVSISDSNIYVYHALGGEINPDQKLKKETLGNFCDALDNLGFGVFRFPLTADQNGKLHKLLSHHYAAGLPFDMKFDLHTDTAMYCSEFVYKMLEQASAYGFRFRKDTLNGLAYVAPDRIFLHPRCSEIRRYVY
ncbi:C40 family peptidase [Filimonas effusa]|nr:YiiX/YebB-like N1pC/P60 family cysteine hydrolase [Filimonas effusa]